MLLSLYHDKPESTGAAETLQNQKLPEKLKALDARASAKGLASLDASKNRLVAIGTETNESGQVTKNGYGVFNLSWQAQEHAEWPGIVEAEILAIRKGIRETHGSTLRFLIWAGMGGSAEDKHMYNATGLLRRGPKCYVLDSTDPAKLKSILEDMRQRSGLSDAEILKGTLIVGMAMGMTSYEPVVNLEKLSLLYERNGIDSRPNFVYMTLPDSLLDRFGRKRGYRKVELQLDNGNSTAGRHSAPMTRGSLYPLALASVDLDEWINSASLSDEEVEKALRLSAFINTQASANRNKVTLLLPKIWMGAGLWTKQDFEESLGKREDFGLKIVIGERPKLANYRPPKDPLQDRCFLAIQIKGVENQDAAKITALRRAGYPVAVITFSKPELSRYMQFMHYAVFGIGYLQNMNFVTQPGVELYKAITNNLHDQAKKSGGILTTEEWRRVQSSSQRVTQGRLTLQFDRLPDTVACVDCAKGKPAAEVYANLLSKLAGNRSIEYGELTFFGDLRYSAAGRKMKKVLEGGAEKVLRSRLRIPADVYEGPAMNHSYHEMIIGHGRCLSTVLLSEKAESLPDADYTADYHRAQFLATQMALAERGRLVVSLLIRDLEDESLDELAAFFRQTAALLKSRPARNLNVHALHE